MESAEPKTEKHARALGFFLGAFTFLAVVITSGSYGMSWDEGFYYPAYRDALGWVQMVFTSPGEAFSAEGIGAGWAEINELPPVTKWLGALSLAIAVPGHELFFMRLVPAVLFGLTVTLVFFTALSIFRERFRDNLRSAMLIAAIVALAYGFHPRIFGHAHFAASETPFAFLTALTLWIAITRDLARWKWRIALAVVLALSVATKVNGLILVTAVGIWLIASPFLTPREEGADQSRQELKRNLLTLGVIAVALPVVSFAIWPWMWDDTAARLAVYWQFMTAHAHYGVWYLGEKWVMPPGSEQLVPWHYPIVMTVAASPIPWTLLMLGGVVLVLCAWIRARGRIGRAQLLLLLAASGPIAAMMLPNAPKYDGLRLFLPAFVPMTLLGAFALQPIFARLSLQRQDWVAVVLMLLVLGFPAGNRGMGLTYYNLPVEMIEPLPFERAYWMETFDTEWFNDIVTIAGRENLRIKTLACHDAVFRIQQGWGDIPAGIEFGGEPPYDFHLVQNRKGFWGRAEWWLAANREPLLKWPANSPEPYFLLYDGRPPGSF